MLLTNSSPLCSNECYSPLCLQVLLGWDGDLYQQDKDGKWSLDYMTSNSLLSFWLTLQQNYGKGYFWSVYMKNTQSHRGIPGDENDIPCKFVPLLRLKWLLSLGLCCILYDNEISLKKTYFSMSPDNYKRWLSWNQKWPIKHFYSGIQYPLVEDLTKFYIHFT